MENSKQIKFSPKFISENDKTKPWNFKTTENLKNQSKKPIIKTNKIQNNKLSDTRNWIKLYNFDNYQICKEGFIRSIQRKSIRNDGTTYTLPSIELKARCTKKHPNMFVEIHLGVDDNSKKIRNTIYLQKAIGEHFVEKPIVSTELYEFTYHIDGNYNNNNYQNIGWCTKADLTQREQKTKFNNGTIKRSNHL